MANVIRIRRRNANGAAGAPSSLQQAELCFNEADNCLYIGVGTGGAGGSATTIATLSSTDFATKTYVTNAISGFGGVTSVGLTLPNIFTVSGSPVTSSGTLSATLATQPANRIFAGPGTGADASPSFRALVAGDLPDISGTYLTTSSASSTYLPLTGGTISNNLTISGNLTVSGTTTTINSTTLAVADKNIELAKVDSPTDATADGAGLTVVGATNHTWNWVDATDAWTSSEHINLGSGKSYYINGTSVLSGSTLGSGVTASSLTSVGTLSGGALGTGFTAVAVAQGGTGLTSAVSGLLKGNGTTYSAATAGTDYLDGNSTLDGGTF